MLKLAPASACGLVTALLFAAPTFAQQARPEADLCAVTPGAQPLLPARLMEGMGTTNMPVTTNSDDARKFFNQGVSQMHSFWFLESERSFLQAATLDPDMAMAYWGISVSAAGDYRPAFQLLRDPQDGGRVPAGGGDSTAVAQIARSVGGAALEPAVRARESIEKAMSLRDKVTPRERLYIEAEAARRNQASKTKDADHIAGLRRLIAAYPDDLEARSILGLALLDGFDSVTKEPRKNTMEGIAMLEAVVAKDDNNFGSHHYLIHGWEGSKTPERAWQACKRYPELVPNIPHALHMPGHIYAQSNRIADAAAAFAAAADNERSYMAADVLYPNGHHGHNVHFLIHALNLEGRYQDSMTQVAHLMNDYKETPRERRGSSQRVTYRQGYYGLVKTLVRFERWNEILDGTTIPVYDRPEQNAWRVWAKGLAYANTGKRAESQAALAELTSLLPRLDASRRPMAVARMELEATIAAHRGDRKQSRYLFRKAADLEAGLLYTEPPAYPRPVVEAWGQAALMLHDYTSAEKAYREALSREPGGGRAMFGLASALTGLGRAADAEKVREDARKAWARADADLPQLKPVTRTADESGAQQ
ncbi:MAG: tetratricopeptide repeat protein [Vicinamibacteria bacterium]